MKPVIFFLSTGRCGTQWLTTALQKFYSDLAVVTHEPILAGYRPKQFLRSNDCAKQMARIPEIASHIGWINGVARTKTYIETGWPCIAAVPYLFQVFGGNLRLVHIVRHPVEVALSLQTQRFYAQMDGHFVKYGQLSPDDPGTVQKSYRMNWELLTSYEKCLFQWAEINSYACEVFDGYPATPKLRLRSEDVFKDSNSLLQLLQFLLLPVRDEILAFTQTRVDQFRKQSPEAVNWELVLGHPETVALAESFGYDFGKVDAGSFASRYVESFPAKLGRIWAGQWHRIHVLIKRIIRRN